MSNEFQLNTNEYITQFDSKDVFSFETDKLVNVRQLKAAVHQSISAYTDVICKNICKQLGWNNNFWFDKGKKCEILRAGSQEWQKGKLKINITLEFIPDKPEETKSPLDDVRQEIDKSDR